MKVVLAGAFGNLGYEILKVLVKENHEIIAADLNEKETELKGKYTFKQIDATKPETLEGVCDGADIVIDQIHAHRDGIGEVVDGVAAKVLGCLGAAAPSAGIRPEVDDVGLLGEHELVALELKGRPTILERNGARRRISGRPGAFHGVVARGKYGRAVRI